MSKKKAILCSVIVIVLVFAAIRLFNHVNYRRELQQVDTSYIFDKTFSVPAGLPATASPSYYSQGQATPRTLELFRQLEDRYSLQSTQNQENHFRSVQQDLRARFSPADAGALFEIYQKYLRCEQAIASDAAFKSTDADPRHMLILMRRIQEHRREKLGRETADILFGADVKEREYTARRAIIITDRELFGQEKEARLLKLKADMWGKQPVAIDEHPETYNRYNLKLQLYAKDLAALNDTERARKEKEFRREFFTAEEMQRLEQADRQIEQADINLRQYREAEKAVQNDATLTQEAKMSKIRKLQDQHFGEEADAFRRRETMYRSAGK